MLTRTSEPTAPHTPRVTGFYEPDTGSIQYLVSCVATKKAAAIDAVMGSGAPKRVNV